jgi:hypothetical protein
MAKRARSAPLLQAELSRRIHRLDDVLEDGVRLTVPLPQAHERDKRGRNWDLKRFDDHRSYARSIREVIDAMRDEFDLADEVPRSRTPNPFE